MRHKQPPLPVDGASRAAALAAFKNLTSKTPSENEPKIVKSTKPQPKLTIKTSRSSLVPKKELDDKPNAKKIEAKVDKKLNSRQVPPTSTQSSKPTQKPSQAAAAAQAAIPSTPVQESHDTRLPMELRAPPVAKSPASVASKSPSSRTTNSSPQQMLSMVRNSINSKAKASSSTEQHQKNQAALSELRESIDRKRVSTHSISSNILLQFSEEDLPTATALYTNYKNSSYSSLGSSLLEDKLDTPVIVINNGNLLDRAFEIPEEPEKEETSLKQRPSMDEWTDFDSKHMETSLSENQSNLSSREMSRNTSMDVSRNVSRDPSRERFMFTNASRDDDDKDYSRLSSSESLRPKPSRKPPPDIASINSSFLDPPDDLSSYYSDSSSVKDVELVSTSKLPQFPDIDSRPKAEHRHSFFKKKNKVKGVDSTVNLLTDNDDELINRSTTSLAPVVIHKQQPVQLKTTMRKTSKRKGKKLEFNEYKPWKNHSELSVITELERKRYEGVWVSNRGNYVNKTVTKLTGVDYNKQQLHDTEMVQEKTMTEEEVLARAAKLSSQQIMNYEGSKDIDVQKFHNIDSAEVNQLIHGVVVKRLWSRSRLPDQTLQAIWNLVDFRQDGTLNKPEFLVGMWLVDQCLYGRKLPKKVEDVVWESLGNIGINVVVKRKGRR